MSAVPKSLSKHERRRIVALFSDNRQLTFSRIERALGIRSNLVAYHVGELVKEGLLVKHGAAYRLSPLGESLLPVVRTDGHMRAALPVVLIAARSGARVLLIKRDKRPYHGYWGLVGGKLLFGESIDACCRRQLATYGITPTQITVRAIANERVIANDNDDATTHSFLLIMVDATISRHKAFPGQIHERWTTTSERATMSIIPSDKWLLSEDAPSARKSKRKEEKRQGLHTRNVTMHEIIMREHADTIVALDVTPVGARASATQRRPPARASKARVARTRRG
jgi:DNA-binding HxlR family transcriptional regulator